MQIHREQSDLVSLLTKTMGRYTDGQTRRSHKLHKPKEVCEMYRQQGDVTSLFILLQSKGSRLENTNETENIMPESDLLFVLFTRLKFPTRFR
jgi:hypothetical protein